jgi:Protein of unknown function (DUF3553)
MKVSRGRVTRIQRGPGLGFPGAIFKDLDLMSMDLWTIGDRVLHAERPEWGVGEIRSAKSTGHNGSASQMLTIRFDRAGIKTLASPPARFRRASDELVAALNAEAPEGEPGPGSAADPAEIDKRFITLPESATDPFKSRRARLESSFTLYRFSAHGASLLDWAAMQTGLKDPLSRFSRHDLERQHGRFMNVLDQHVKKLAFDVKKEDPAGYAAAIAAAPAEAKQALRRIDMPR